MERTHGRVQEKHPGPGFISARILPHLLHHLFSVGLSSMGKPGIRFKSLYMGKSVKFALEPEKANPEILP